MLSSWFSSVLGSGKKYLVTTNGALKKVGMLSLSFLSSAAAWTCFENKGGHDYSINCSDNEDGLAQLLKKQCATYNDGQDDCARFFIDRVRYGIGYFAGSMCDLTYHDSMAPLDDCIDQIMKSNVKDGYGTTEDYIVTGILGVGTVLTLYGLFKLKQRMAQQQPQAAPLLPQQGDDLEAPLNYGTFRAAGG